MMGHLATSLVVIVAIASDWVSSGETIYGIIVACLSAVIVMALVWYLFLKPSDYTIRFEVKTFPGAINQTIKFWDVETGKCLPLAFWVRSWHGWRCKFSRESDD